MSRTMDADRPDATRRVLDEVFAERRRHVDVEAFTPDHDDEHPDGELARAGGLYAQHAVRVENDFRFRLPGSPPQGWPWEPRWWKPKDPRRDLIRAAALIIAEVEKIDRAQAAGRTEYGAGRLG